MIKSIAIFICIFLLTACSPKTSNTKAFEKLDFGYMLHMNELVVKEILDYDGIIYSENRNPQTDYHSVEYTLDDCVVLAFAKDYIDVENDFTGTSRLVSVTIDYTKTTEKSKFALMNVDGNYTFDDFVRRFGEQYTYPTFAEYINTELAKSLVTQDKSKSTIAFSGNLLGKDEQAQSSYDGPLLYATYGDIGAMERLCLSSAFL